MSARARTCACMYVWMCAFMRVLVWGSELEIKQWLIAVAACLDGYAGERVWGTEGRWRGEMGRRGGGGRA